METYGFNSRRTPPAIEEMKVFETRMEETIKNIKFRPSNGAFQQQIRRDVRNLRKEEKVFVKADKTTNYYKMEPGTYQNLLDKNIQKSYKKTEAITEYNINSEAQSITTKLKLEDRIEKMAKKESFITLKDHKPNFQNSAPCRLINPTKSEIGKISKQITERIVKNVRNKTSLSIWRSTQEVIEWFKEIPNKSQHSFVCFDIVDFYPSINQTLLSKAITFASEYDKISEQEKNIIMHAKKTVLINKDKPWIKTTSNEDLFDVTMGSYDGAETCELVVLYLLDQLKHVFNGKIGLYRDDGLAVSDKPPREIENMKKKICKLFTANGLKITIEANQKSVNYLDTTLDLNTGIFKPYKKPNDTPLYVNAKSNHPPNVIKAVPKSINKRLSAISSNKEVFDEAAPTYQKALYESGYTYKLNYEPQQTTNEKKRKRKRKITWFNPPYDQSVETNIGKKFLKDIDESFPRGHKLRKIFNRNTIKLSYSCMPNVKQIVDAHNKKKLNNTSIQQSSARSCNCRATADCPLQGNCLAEGIVYQATVTSDNNQEQTYIGLTNTTFKLRYANHTSSFNNNQYRNQTELSKYIWSLKDKNKNFSIKWKLLKKAKAYTNVSKRCNLCIMEKWYILKHPEMASLNSRTELVNTCRHASRYLLQSLR